MSQMQDHEVLQIMGAGSFGTCFEVQNKLTHKLFVWRAIDCGEITVETKRSLIDHGYRPTVDLILHHTTVLTNLSSTKSYLPKLIADAPDAINHTLLEYGENNNTTQILQRDVFVTSSPKREHHAVGFSPEADSDIEHSMRPNAIEVASNIILQESPSPEEIAKDVFNQAFKLRLQAIKEREKNLCEREKLMKEREQMLMRRERNVNDRPFTASSRPRHRRSSTAMGSRKSTENKRERHVLRCATVHGASYASLENDVFVAPTIAKMNPDRLFRPKSFQKKVSFQRSPHKLKNNEIGKVATVPAEHVAEKLVKTKESKRSTKKKSFFRIFGLNLNHLRTSGAAPRRSVPPIAKAAKETHIQTKVENDELLAEYLPVGESPVAIPTKWTSETKRTAFKMLSILNAAEVVNESQSTIFDSVIVDDQIVRHDRKRQSMIIVKR